MAKERAKIIRYPPTARKNEPAAASHTVANINARAKFCNAPEDIEHQEFQFYSKVKESHTVAAALSHDKDLIQNAASDYFKAGRVSLSETLGSLSSNVEALGQAALYQDPMTFTQVSTTVDRQLHEITTGPITCPYTAPAVGTW